mgnify:FL=1
MKTNFINRIYRAIKIDPQIEGLYNNRCWAKYKLGKFKKALIDCDQALLLNPKDSYAYDSRGDVKFALGDKKGACSDYKNAISNGYKEREEYLASKEGSWCRNMPN